MTSLRLLLLVAALAGAAAQAAPTGSAVGAIPTAGVRYKGYTYSSDIATPVFQLGQDVCSILDAVATNNQQQALNIYNNGLNAYTTTGRVALRDLVNRTAPQPVHGFGGSLYRSFFSGVSLSSPADIHRQVQQAINNTVPINILRTRHSLEYTAHTKIIVDEWEKAIVGTARNTTQGRQDAIRALDRAWGYYTGNVLDNPNPNVQATCDDDLSYHVDNWATTTTAQYHPGGASFIRMTMADTFNSAVSAVRARNATALQQLGHRVLSLQASFGLGTLLFTTYSMDLAVLCNRPTFAVLATAFAHDFATTTAAILHGKGVSEANTAAFLAAALPDLANHTATNLVYPPFRALALQLLSTVPDMDTSLVGNLDGMGAALLWSPFGNLTSLTDCPSPFPPT